MSFCVPFMYGDMYPDPFVKNDFLLMSMILKSPCI